MTDKLINGECCFWCGIVFEMAHEHPVLCKDCYELCQKDPKFPKATHQEEKNMDEIFINVDNLGHKRVLINNNGKLKNPDMGEEK